MNAASGVLALQGGDGERLSFAGLTILLRVPSEASGGAFSLFEEVPPLAGTPLHVHRDEDELFYVLEGERVFRIGDDEHTLGPEVSCSRRAECRTRSAGSCQVRVAS